MGAPDQELSFHEDDLGAVLDLQAELAALDPPGWINFRPEVEPGHEPAPRSMLVSVFSAKGDPTPFATWMPQPGGRRVTLGIEHGSGPKALDRLAAAEWPLPEGWLKLNDHPRRGLVVVAPATDPETTLRWLLLAAHALSTVPLTGDWTALAYRP